MQTTLQTKPNEKKQIMNLKSNMVIGFICFLSQIPKLRININKT